MKTKIQKVFAVVLVFGITIAFLLNVNAETSDTKVTFADAYLTFEVWQGSGTASVSIGNDFLTKDNNLIKFNEFEEIQYGEKKLDVSSYKVTEAGENTVITLNEEYLKTLNDGTYMFDAVFSRAIIPIRLHIITHKVILEDAYFTFEPWAGSGTAQVRFKPNTFSVGFYPELFNDLWYKGKIVDRLNYSISGFANEMQISLKEEYVKTLPAGEHYFTADFMNANINLKLKVGMETATTENIDTTTKFVNKLTQVKKVKAVSKKKKLSVKWKKQKNVTGYRIMVGTNKKFTKNKKIITIKKNNSSVIIKRLKPKKKYYLKVRSYKKVNGIKYWGPWSEKISKKTK